MRTRLRADTGLPLQVGALPFRKGAGDRLEVMLVTGKGGGSWIVPKGWPMRGRTLAEAAAQEAYEEAGVRGRMTGPPIGRFDNRKNHRWLGPIECTIEVYPMQVTHSLGEWPEKGLRRRRWFDEEEATGVLRSGELRALVRAFLGGDPAAQALRTGEGETPDPDRSSEDANAG